MRFLLQSNTKERRRSRGDEALCRPQQGRSFTSKPYFLALFEEGFAADAWTAQRSGLY